MVATMTDTGQLWRDAERSAIVQYLIGLEDFTGVIEAIENGEHWKHHYRMLEMKSGEPNEAVLLYIDNAEPDRMAPAVTVTGPHVTHKQCGRCNRIRPVGSFVDIPIGGPICDLCDSETETVLEIPWRPLKPHPDDDVKFTIDTPAGRPGAESNELVSRMANSLPTNLPTPQPMTVTTSKTSGTVSVRMVPRDEKPDDEGTAR
jgi:hypothetical protein